MKSADAPSLISWLVVLGDMTRLRILALLDREELGVGELAKIVQLPQSTVSRHLKLLFESGWIAKRAAGTASLYRLRANDLQPAARELWNIAREQVRGAPGLAEDLHRLEEVLAARQTDSKEFFGRIGGEWDEHRRELFGREFSADALLGLLSPEMCIADVGCGTGDAAAFLAPIVKKVIAIDREPAMLTAARKRLKGLTNVEFRRGDLDDLPVEDSEVDAAIAFLVLHHVDDPDAAVGELSRIIRPGGVILILDMVAHERDSYRHTMGHVHLGFTEKDVRRWARGAKLKNPGFRRLRPDPEGKGPSLFVATMWRER